MHISPQVVKATFDGISGLLKDNHKEIEEAYCNEEDSLSLSFSVKYSPAKKGNGVSIETSINFIKDRVKQKIQTIVDPNKDSLTKHIDDMQSGLKKGESVKISSGGKTVEFKGK